MAIARSHDDATRAGAIPGRLEAALARAEATEAMYRSLIDRLPAITYTEALDDGRTLSISPQIEALLGCTQDEWMADPLIWVGMMHPDDRDRVLAECLEANREERPFRSEYRMIARDGRVLWFRDEADAVLGSAGQRLCWQGVMFDITPQKEAEELARQLSAATDGPDRLAESGSAGGGA